MNQRVLMHSVFVGLYPEPEAARGLDAAQRRLRTEFGVPDRALTPAGRLHVSLFGLTEQPGAPRPARIDQIAGVLSRVRMGAFRIAFNTVCSFRGKRSSRAVVLTGDDGVIGVSMLGDAIEAAFRAAGFGGWRASTPHLTLAWSDVTVPETPTLPVTWTAREFVLIDSIQGAGRHQVLGRWGLKTANSDYESIDYGPLFGPKKRDD